MRVLSVGNMYPPHHLGGYELVWRSSTLALRAAGHEVRVLTTGYRRPEQPSGAELDPDVHRSLRWYWHEGDFPAMSRLEVLRLERHNRMQLRRQIRDFRPDVLSWWAMGGMSLSLIEHGRRAGLPAAGFPHDDWMVYGPQVDRWSRGCAEHPTLARVAGTAFDLAVTATFARAGRWVFNSDFTRSRAVESGRVPEEVTDVASPGIDDAMFAPAERPPWRWQLLYVGRLDERKGVDTAVDCLAMLPDETELTVVGGGDAGYAARLRARVESAGLAARVQMVPQLDRPALSRRYAESDVLVFPVTWDEPWGLVPLEAMAVGTPVIATGTGGSAEYLADGVNSLLFEPGDAGALAGAVRSLAEDEGLRDRIRTGGLETAARHTETLFNQRVESVLDDAVQSRQA